MLIISISRYHEQPNQIGPQIGFNNQARNPRLINNKLCMLIIAISLIVVVFHLKGPKGLGKGLGIFTVSISWGLIFPSLFYCFNPKVRQFYIRMFWGEAPDWMQQLNPNGVVDIQLHRY